MASSAFFSTKGGFFILTTPKTRGGPLSSCLKRHNLTTVTKYHAARVHSDIYTIFFISGVYFSPELFCLVCTLCGFVGSRFVKNARRRGRHCRRAVARAAFVLRSCLKLSGFRSQHAYACSMTRVGLDAMKGSPLCLRYMASNCPPHCSSHSATLRASTASLMSINNYIGRLHHIVCCLCLKFLLGLGQRA